MPQLQKQEDFTPCPPGEHLFTLLDVEQRKFQSDYAKSADGMVDKLMWKFVSDTIDPASGKGWMYTHFTGLAYGNHKAALTILLNQIIEGLAKMPKDAAQDFAASLNTDSLLGSRYKAFIRHDLTEKGDVRPVLAFIAPLKVGAAELPHVTASTPSHSHFEGLTHRLDPVPVAPQAPESVQTPQSGPVEPPKDWKGLFAEVLETLQARGYSATEATELVKKNVKPRDVAGLDEFYGKIFYGEFDKPGEAAILDAQQASKHDGAFADPFEAVEPSAQAVA